MTNGTFSPGQELELEITGYASEGEGVGKRSGGVFFVPGAARGERIRARVTAGRKSPYRAVLLDILEPSPERRDPPCPYFGACGGCQLQHLSYTEQLRFKETRVRDAMERIGRLAGVTIAPIRGMDDPWRYRNKVTFAIANGSPFADNGPSADGGPEATGIPAPGFFAGGSRRVIPVTDCLLADPSAVPIARRALELVHLRLGGPGPVTSIMVRTAFAAGERLAVIHTEDRPLPRAAEIAEALIAFDTSLAGVYQARTEHGERPAAGYHLITGRPAITEKLSALSFPLTPDSFFQINTRQAEALYTTAANSLLPAAGARVIDAYCGVGGFALMAAARAVDVLGIERERGMVERARAIARANGIAHARFAVGDLETGRGVDPRALALCTTLIVDPPRRGLEARFIASCRQPALQRIIYASCDPGTLARDCRRFAERGFAVREIIPFDMFPHTSQVECLALLEPA
jgi:23S rRNA (uracil1939-C5)-methyltransferase